MNREIKFIDLGLMDYKEAWDFQQNLFDEIVDIKKKTDKRTQKLKPQIIFFLLSILMFIHLEKVVIFLIY